MERNDIDLLIVDDEDDFRRTAAAYFRKLGYCVEEAASGDAALETARKHDFDVAVIDIHMPGMTGIDLLEQLRADSPNLQAIMLTGGGTIENAVEAMKRGAFDYLTKPARMTELDVAIQKADAAGRLQKENEQLRAVLKRQTRSSTMIGDSEAMKAVHRLIARVAATDKPILIEGESGTGKELVAREIHRQSSLADRPLVVINCAALPETLLESELFGHEKGAFTGAAQAKPGLFEIADGGTLFIDEFGDLAGPLQAKLLRVLEDGSMRRLGSVKERRVRVRIIAATNRDMAREVNEGRFREDLYYRINVLTIRLPPLRERKGDISLLVKHFVGEEWTVSDEVLRQLEAYSWPGNVRQLRNALERAMILAEQNRIELTNMPPEVVAGSQSSPAVTTGADVDLETLNRMHVLEVFKHHQGNKARTARALGIGRRSLYRLLEKYGIESADDI